MNLLNPLRCRHCNTNLAEAFLDLGGAPYANDYLNIADLSFPEKYYPLRVHVCDKCWLVQTFDTGFSEDLFKKDYAYFSSISVSWLAHAKSYSKLIVEELSLTNQSFVVEVASNDGYLLRNFVERNIPCLGIEPTESTAKYAESLGVPVVQEFFGSGLAVDLIKLHGHADLIIANNVLAHVPDINDFVAGLKVLLSDDGVITAEFPHLYNLLLLGQFDTIYHEHFSYFSLSSISQIFRELGLEIWKVEVLSTHGGSLRIYARHSHVGSTIHDSVNEIIEKEANFGLNSMNVYYGLQKQAITCKIQLLKFLMQVKVDNKRVAGYGAAAKGNTLLNFAGVKSDLLPFIVDAAPSKQGKYMPGSHIPIMSPNFLAEFQPDYLLVLPWNLIDEISASQVVKSLSGVQLVTAIPEVILHG